MNGFLIHYGHLNDSIITNQHSFLERIGQPITEIIINRFFHFLGWGPTPGDIFYSRNGDISCLILNGYIAVAEIISPFSSQQEVSDLLLKALDEDHSIDRCCHIAEQIYGSFSIIYVNFAEQKIICLTDRMSSRPVWCKEAQASFFVSSNPNAIASIGNIQDYDLGALGAILLYGGPVDPCKSIYKGIVAFEQGSVNIIENSKKQKKCRWYIYKHKPNATISYNEWVEIASKSLQNAARRILKTCSSPIIFFSGGIDSRLTASAFRSVGGDPLLVTLCDGENLELKVAKKAAMALDCRHHIIMRDKHWYLKNITKSVFDSGGSFLWTHGHFSNAYNKMLTDFTVDAALLGDFCEAFSKLFCVVPDVTIPMWSLEEFLANFDKLHLPFYRPTHREITLNLINPEVRLELEKHLQNDIVSRFNQICNSSDDPRIVADFFFRWEYAATLATYSMFLNLRSAGPERSIMFDKEVHNLFEILPSSMRYGANLGACIIKKLWPAAAKVANANTLLPLCWPMVLHRTSKVFKPLLGKIRRFFFENSYKTTGSWQKKSILYVNDPEWKMFFEKMLLDDSNFNKDIFDTKQIENHWINFCGGNSSLAGDLEKIIHFGLLFKKAWLA